MSVLPRGATVRRDAGLYGYERALRRVGLEPVAGVDEAGRGACAGPLVAAAVVLPDGKRGQVPTDDVVGKVFAVAWPFAHATVLHTPATFGSVH